MDNLKKFIEKARKIHGDKYDYSKVNYIGSQERVCIICPIHGEFWQKPSEHIRGCECPKCANEKRGNRKRWSKDDFIDRAITVHGTRYTYENVEYKNNNTPVSITCPEHGEFWQTPLSHVFGKCGCPKCAGRNLNTEEVIEKFREVHGDRYDYSKTVFNKMHEKVIIICPEHGEFLQTPSKHINGQGCPKCGKSTIAKLNMLSTPEFIKRANDIHNGFYTYPNLVYGGRGIKVEIECPKHGPFYQLPFDHLDGHGCPKCAVQVSKEEEEIYEYCCSVLGEENVERRNRKILGGNKELDIYLPNENIAIEYNGLYWHSEEMGKTKFYHLRKTEKCEEHSIKLIQIFEDEYKEHKEIVLDKILHLLKKDGGKPKVMARKCMVKKIERDVAREFLNQNHIQGYGNASLSIGCFYENKIIGVMSFLKAGKEREWILTRFTTDINYICQGVGGKLFSYFIKNYNPDVVKSFADRRWTLDSDDNLYTKLGFELSEVLEPDYHYIYTNNPQKRIHKFNLRKKTLHVKYNLNLDLTESQMVKEVGFSKIWDCGLYKYVWKK